MKQRLIYFITYLTVITKITLSQNPGDSLFNTSVVHDINIVFSQPGWWDSLMHYKQHADSFNLSTQPMMGDIIIDGTLIDSIGVKLKGNSSYGYPGQKKSIKIEFNEYVSGKKYDGLKTIILNNNTLDPTMMREKLALDFLNKKGLAAPRCTYAKVSYNGQYVGLYKLVESIDKTFLKTHYGNKGGNLFKGDPGGSLGWIDNNPSSYYASYELHTNTTANDWSDLVNFIDKVNNTPVSEFYDTLENNLNTNSFIGQWAARNLFVDLDAYFHAPHNYYLYHNTATNKFEWNTWDVSVSFGFYPFWSEDSTVNTDILMSNGGQLTQRMLDNSTYKTQYLNTICEYLDYFNDSVLFQQIDSIAAVIYPYFVAEPDSNQMFQEGMFYATIDTMTIPTGIGDIPGLKRFIVNRRNNVLNQLAAIPFTCTNGISEIKNSYRGILVYPNPFSSETTLRVNADLKNATFTICNTLGQQVKQITNCQGSKVKIERGNLQSGMYYVQLIQDNKIIATTKLVITD